MHSPSLTINHILTTYQPYIYRTCSIPSKEQMLCGVEEPLDVQQLRLTARMEGFDEDFKERGDGENHRSQWWILGNGSGKFKPRWVAGLMFQLKPVTHLGTSKSSFILTNFFLPFWPFQISHLGSFLGHENRGETQDSHLISTQHILDLGFKGWRPPVPLSRSPRFPLMLFFLPHYIPI